MRDASASGGSKSKAVSKASKSGPADGGAEGKKRFEVKKVCNAAADNQRGHRLLIN